MLNVRFCMRAVVSYANGCEKKRKESVDFACQRCNECMAPSPLFSIHSTTDTVIISCARARQSSARRVGDPSTFSRNAPHSLPHRRRGSSATGPPPTAGLLAQSKQQPSAANWPRCVCEIKQPHTHTPTCLPCLSSSASLEDGKDV